MLQKDQPIHLIWTDFGSELWTIIVDQLIFSKKIMFEPFTSYSQEENGILERKDRILMECVRYTIIRGGYLMSSGLKFFWL